MAKIASFVLFLIVSLPLASLAQDKEPINLNLNIPIDEQLPSLDSLIEMAVAHNPTVKLNQELVGIAADKVKLERNSWTEMVRGYYDYSADNPSLVVTGVQSSDLNKIGRASRRER